MTAHREGVILLGEVAARAAAMMEIRCGRRDWAGRLCLQRLVAQYRSDVPVWHVMEAEESRARTATRRSRTAAIPTAQRWANPAAEQALYDSMSMREFVGVDLGRERVPDETIILNFRHLLERHGLGQKLFEQVNTYLTTRGMKVAGGTIVDATIIAAASLTKNQAKERDPEMHQTRKGQQWYFGMTLYFGVDSKRG